jgi:hypothetical protein
MRPDREEVKLNNMRKLFALAMVALLSLTLAFALVSCGKKAEETPAENTMPPAETTPADSGMAMDTTAHDTAMAH